MTNALTNAQKDTPKLMPALHKACGFDFCKPYAVKETYGKFTENKIRKAMAEETLEGESITPSTHKIIILTKDSRDYRYGTAWVLVEILSNNVNIDIRSPYSLRQSFDYFYTKSRYNEFRKSDTCQTVILAQKYEYLCFPKKYALDMSKRMSVIDYDYCYSYRMDKRYISSVTVKGDSRKNDSFYVDGIETENVDEIIDKSGYLLYTRRIELKRRLTKRKAEIAKTLADRTDFSEHVTTLTNLVAYKKGMLTEQFKACETYADYREFNKLFSYFDGFINIVNDVEGYCTRVNEKRFDSVEAEERLYNSIMARLMK